MFVEHTILLRRKYEHQALGNNEAKFFQVYPFLKKSMLPYSFIDILKADKPMAA